MKRILLLAMLGIPLSAHAAGAIIDWALGKAVEDTAEQAITDGIKKQIAGGLPAKKHEAKPVPAKSEARDAKRTAPVERGPLSWPDLPMSGKYRFPIPKDILDVREGKLALSKAPKTGQHGGYIDRFGSEWQPGICGKHRCWNVTLSEIGKLRWGGMDTVSLVQGENWWNVAR